MADIEARRATEDDVDQVVAIVTAAFAQDPLWSHALAVPGGGTEHHARFWRLFVEGPLPSSWVWLANDGEAASVWVPPGGIEMSEAQEHEFEVLAREVLGPKADPCFELLESFEEAHPRKEPHYYLSLLATHPDHRGHGIGMALLRHNLELVDAEGLPAYLESTNPVNDQRYQSAGFSPVGSFSYPGGSPLVTTMWRPGR